MSCRTDGVSFFALLGITAACGGEPVSPDAHIADATRDGGTVDGGALDGAVADGGVPSACRPCPRDAYCNETTAECVSLDVVCPSSGAPMGAFSDDALGVATNELTWPSIIGIDPVIAWNDLATIRPRWVQLGILWSDLEPEPGVEDDWPRWDAIYDEATSRDLAPIAVHTGPPAWAITGAGTPTPRVDVDAWRRFVRRVVAHYGSAGTGAVRDFQFWNEPNLGWEYGERQYTELLVAMADEVHADPNARMWGPGVETHAWGYDGWPDAIDGSETMRWLELALAADVIDVVAMHFYYRLMGRLVDVVRHYAARISRYRNGHVPFVVNEFNTDDYCGTERGGEDVHARYAANFYNCLWANGVDGALIFNATDFVTPTDPAQRTPGCRDSDYFLVGLRSHDGHARSVRYAVEHLARRVEAQGDAAARIEALPAVCVTSGRPCVTTLAFARRHATRSVQLRNADSDTVLACLAPAELHGTFDVPITAPSRFDLYEAPTCDPTAAVGAPLDSVHVQTTAEPLETTGGALVHLDGPCTIAPGDAGCAATLAWWSSGIDVRYPYVQIRMGAAMWRCEPANAAGIARTMPWVRDHRFRLYEAAGCTDTSELGRLLAATRAVGESDAEP